MRQILGIYASRIGKSKLRLAEGNPVFRLVFPILIGIPIEMGFGHAAMVSGNHRDSHTKVWLTDRLYCDL